MKYKITLLSKSTTKSSVAYMNKLLKSIGDAFKCEFEVVGKELSKKENLSAVELELFRKSDAVLIESEKPFDRDDKPVSQLGVIETVSADGLETGTPESETKKVAYYHSLASLLDYLKLNDAAKLVRQGLDQAKKTGSTLHISNQKLAESISAFVKSRFKTSVDRRVAERMLLSFGGEVEQ